MIPSLHSPDARGDKTSINHKMSGNHLATPHVLCRYCRELCSRANYLQTSLQEWIECRDQIPDQDLEHCPNIFELKKSSSSGCHLCILLWNSIRQQTLTEIAESSAARCRPISLKLWDPNRGNKIGVFQMKLTLQLKEFNSYPASNERDLWVRHEADIPQDEHSSFNDAQLSLSTGSVGCLRLAKHWLTQCTSKHVECCLPTTQPNVLPTRLIDVEARASFELRLHIVDQNDSGIRYLTLSHCWGNLDVLTLKAENIGQMMDGFHMRDLPKTFKDAVEITKSLGFRYLWIDALCIIQDSPADWKREASRMASVYENSTCTRGALFGANSHAGCFKSRQPLEHFSCRISQAGSNDVFVTSKHVFWELIDENGTGPGQPGPLNNRAWVVQERMMSPRTLYFGSRRIHWECRTYTSTDHGIETDFNTDGYTSHAKHACDILRAPLRPLAVRGDRYLFYIGWNTFLNKYTHGRLTRPEDRLVALTGIVDIARRSTALSMVSGLWKELLPFEILWSRDFYMDDSDLVPPPQYNRAPSWSWASQDGPVHAADVSFAKAPMFFVEDIELEDPLEEVDSGDIARSENCILHISGPLTAIENHVILREDNKVYTLWRNFQTGNIEDRCFVVFDPDQPSSIHQLSSPVQLSCLLISRSSPMPGNYAHGLTRMFEVLALKRIFSSGDHEMDREGIGQSRGGVNRKGSGNTEGREYKNDDDHNLSANDNDNSDYEDKTDDYEDMEEGYEYNKLDVCDHGLVLQATKLEGRYRRVGVFRSYLYKHGQTLFETIPLVAKISIE
jgi:hypothetical protein